MFDHILNWELKKGSHEFPGPAGGTCINEAAIVAAGFPYQPVKSAYSMPPCFSRVLAQYAMVLNDFASDAARQELLPFVTRLAGTADSVGAEWRRAEFIVLATVQRITSADLLRRTWSTFSIPMKARGNIPIKERRKLSHRCEQVRDLIDAKVVVREAVWLTGGATRFVHTERMLTEFELSSQIGAMTFAGDITYGHSRTAIQILDDALKIGKQAEPIEVTQVAERMEVAKRARKHKRVPELT